MIRTVLITPDAHREAKKLQLVKQLQKAVYKIKSGDTAGVFLKKRKPQSNDIWQFRITKKYRAYAKKKDKTLIVYHIDDHQ